jgi:hypothetical protein
MEKSKDDATKRFLAMTRRTEYYDPKILIENMHHIIHIHGKFYEMDENNEETTLDYPGILKALVEGGYNGYISAEYEGAPIGGDTFEPFRRYQKMLDKYLGKYPDDNYPDWPDSAPPPGPLAFGVPINAYIPGTFKNHYEDGKITGFELDVRSYYYRGVPLALCESCHVSVNGKLCGPESMRVAVDGEVFKFEDMCDVTLHYWNKGCGAKIIVDLPGGLNVGETYDLAAVVEVRAYYMREGIAGQIASTAIRMPEAAKVVLEA